MFISYFTETVPTASMTELNSNLKNIFKMARKLQTGVYILNKKNIEGVILTQQQYENLLQTIEDYEDQFDELIVLERLNDNSKRVSDEDLRGKNNTFTED
ncbi:hypothetical protein E2558_08175 [Staphylococcus pragensis]|uniref:Antitoxin n=1 Tax=Staphylococcus pragensis TaxID=1611836 RepID=A0A4Z1BDY5_9STAP|nr:MULTISPECIES: hypothetical protein [Staphylococcus]RTX91976.1 hypothetical protein CD154_01225 [Staphylococcus carnosus]TGN26944.1 hypothetical protein E2558_08175 [Staphylococcus pragensis]GGG94039.1 hypothetical protein GCM10007342_16400 [Staphylococcus pragensis]